PIVHGFELLRLEMIEAMLTLLLNRDEARLAEHAQMLGDRGLGNLQAVDELADGVLATSQDLDNRASAGLRDRIEHVGGGGDSGHAKNIFHLKNMSTWLR